MARQTTGIRVLKAAAAVAALPAAIAGAFALASHAIWHRSTAGTLAELALRSSRARFKLEDDITFDNHLLDRAQANEERYVLPTLFSPRVKVNDEELCGMQVITLNRRSLNDRAVIYLHGGSYLTRPRLEEWRFLDTLASKTRAEVVVPMYPLAPVHSFEEAYAAVDSLWEAMCERYGADNLTVMGAGSGGGLAAGFTESLAIEGRKTPKNLILLSPWVDMTFKNPDIQRIEAVDPILAVPGLQKVARLWSAGTELTDYRLSPGLGDVRSLPRLNVFVGTREVFYPDAKLFCERTRAAGVRAKLHEGHGLNHLYPFLRIPEGKRAVERIVAIVTQD